MAKDTSQIGTRRFDKELNEDVNDFHLPDNSWTHARNAINNSKTGDLGKLGNEPSTLKCVEITYANCSNTALPKIIGTIHIYADKWLIYSTNGTCHEIGIFTESLCTYDKIVNDPCLNFSPAHLIKGVTRPVVTCTYRAYWDDGLNPTRFITFDADNPANNQPFLPPPAAPNTNNPLSPVPWVQVPDPNNSATCNNTINTNQLDCDKLRLATFIDTPCIEVQTGFGSGTLLNGSYMVAVAYAVNGLKVSDWYISNVQGLFDHKNASSSLDVLFNSLDTTFEEVQLVVISIVNQQTVARLAGVYSTRQKRVSFDTIDNTWPSVPIEQIPIVTPIIEKTDATYSIGSYLTRTGTTSKFNFNYQPLANQIITKWQSVEYPADYYRKGGNKTNYLRDEIYSFFIRWVYDTGDKSPAFHIPGRPKFANYDGIGSNKPDTIATDPIKENWFVDNTASITNNTLNTVLPDGGVVISEGIMGYWESSEQYPDNNPEVWNSETNILNPAFNITGLLPYSNEAADQNIGKGSIIKGQFDLCGRQIRHHKFPDLYTDPGHSLEYTNPVTGKIRILGVKFNNIKPPINNDGTPVTGIVGYEILRSTRNGNKTILAKGLINNMRGYTIPSGTSTNNNGLYVNYPYNDLGEDVFLSSTQVTGGGQIPYEGDSSKITGLNGYVPLRDYKNDIFSFHSPDTNFTEPFLSAKEIKIHGEYNGNVTGQFQLSEKHPREKLITNTTFVISAICGVGIASLAINGQRKVNYISPQMRGYSEENIPKKTYYDDLKQDASGYVLSSIFAAGSIFPVAIDITGSVDATGDQNYSGNTENKQDELLKTSPTQADEQAIKNNAAKAYMSAFSSSGIPSGYYESSKGGPSIAVNLTGEDDFSQIRTLETGQTAAAAKEPFMSSGGYNVEQADGAYQNIPGVLKKLSTTATFMNYFSQGTETVLNFFKAFIRYNDFALRYQSHCLYNRYLAPPLGERRRAINNSIYLDSQITTFLSNPNNPGTTYNINNLYRSKCVVLSTDRTIKEPQTVELTRIRASDVELLYEPEYPITGSQKVLKDPAKQAFGRYDFSTKPFGLVSHELYYQTLFGKAPQIQVAASHFASLKQRLRNQYGQINGTNIVPVSTCTTPLYVKDSRGVLTLNSSTDVLFGGDTYLGRYTEKNTFFFFYNWLYGEPDGAQFDYTKNYMIPYPVYWANFDQFETGDFMSSIWSAVQSFSFSNLVLPEDYYSLDAASQVNYSWKTASSIHFSVRYAWYYLFNSGVKDFYVESEVNLDFRDWGELETERHYDPYRYTELKQLFDTKIIKATNYYKYDFSLSYSKLFLNYTSWSTTQPYSYNPYLAESCFIYTPNKIIYSLPNQYESLRDNWSIFLTNNYKDFESKVTCIKPVNKSGAMIFFETISPVMFQGTDTLETGLGTKLVIGDGGLFAQPLQNISNADRPYEYASCQDRLSVINTPLGIYWTSQNQGKVFSFTNSLTELSMNDIKWWLVLYLPFKIVQQFPNFALTDNPVLGVGTQTIYDNQNGLIYFTKKDYSLKTNLPSSIKLKYVNENIFDVYINGQLSSAQIYLGDNTKVDKKTGIPFWKTYFDDASWTISYDPKIGSWISYHDWHPDLMMPGKNTFLSTKDNAIWIHNLAFQSYNNYYGINYPFEVEYVVNTIQTITTLRSIEYQLECYKYDNNAFDRFHVLDFNFDKAVIYNTEQVSGYLNLILDPKNDPAKILNYPIINPNTSIDILYSKEENKYRFNQFWDITDDRGEYNPIAQRMIWNTGANGYDRVLNSFNLNYTKDVFQRKKFRHYTNTVWLRKDPANDTNLYPTGSNPYKMLVILTNNKELYSPR